MPRIKSILLRLTTAGALATVCAGVGAAPALAGTISNVNKCSAPTLTQPFLAWGDTNWYVLASGQRPDAFGGNGWTLTGGASIVKTTLADGSTGTVLDLPSGSKAVSPTVCLSSNYPEARTMIRNVFGPPNLAFYVDYETTGQTAISQLPSPSGGAWTLSPPFGLYPSSTAGWQLASFTFSAGTNASDVQIYNFYVDPYSKR